MKKIVFLISFILISCGISPEEARKDLTALGVPFEDYALRDAAQKCDDLVVDKFLAAEMTPDLGLVGAVEGRCLDLVKKLVKKTDNQQPKVFSLNRIAISNPQPSDLEIAKILLNSGADPNSKINGENSYIHDAVANENMPLINLLLSKGAKANDYNGNHSLAIIEAAEKSKELTQLLLDNGANPDSFPCEYGYSNYCSPLLAATTRGNLETLSLLLANGANANDTEGNIKSKSLEKAASQKNLELIKKLVEAGAKINDPEEGYSKILTNAFSKSYRDKDYSWNVIKYLLDNGAKADPKKAFLTLAFENNQYDLAQSMLKNGIELNSTEVYYSEEKSSWALMKAVENNAPKAVKILLDHGANPNSKVSNYSKCNILSTAIRNNYQEIVTLLQEKGGVRNCG